VKFSLALAAAVALAVSGCGVLESKKVDYKSATKLPSTLEVPPDLVTPSSDNRYAIPDAREGAATASGFQQQRATPVSAGALLPQGERARIERAGSQRWLVVQAPPAQVWPAIRDFWLESGFIVNLESAETGVMETDWAENRAKIPQDMIRRTLGKVIDGLYSTPERDKFRTRIESGANGTEIYISHRGMMEVYATEGKDKTVWQPRPNDPELEAEMLRRLMLRLGVAPTQADALLADAPAPERARLVKNGGATELEVDDGFDQAWRRVGLALDRAGFAVEDRDRSKGTYFVRYIDPQADNDSKRDDGILAKFAFWKSDKKAGAPQQLQILVVEDGGKSRVSVAGVEAGTQGRVVTLLHKELK
jgi:outer membrane protein assembly factor BamC